MKQLGGLQAQWEAFQKTDTEILAIHVECPPGGTEKLAKKKNFSFALANDDVLNVVDKYSVTSTYLIDKKGIIRGRWLDQVHDRVEAKIILQAVNKLE